MEIRQYFCDILYIYLLKNIRLCVSIFSLYRKRSKDIIVIIKYNNNTKYYNLREAAKTSSISGQARLNHPPCFIAIRTFKKRKTIAEN